jgi:hypothetical protein
VKVKSLLAQQADGLRVFFWLDFDSSGVALRPEGSEASVILSKVISANHF